MTNKPTNLAIYEKIKEEIDKKYKPSAYRSGLLVKTYKTAMQRLGQPAYVGRKNPNEGLKKWFNERWTNQRGEENYKFKSDIYRPTVRVNDRTPTTFSELSREEIEKARRKKYIHGRVDRFKK